MEKCKEMDKWSIKMVIYMKDNEKMEKCKEMEQWHIKMDLFIKDNEKKVKNMEKAKRPIKINRFTMVYLKIIKDTVKVSGQVSKGLIMKVNGNTENYMEMECMRGKMEIYIMDFERRI